MSQGSPFISENAARLRAMGWLVLTMQGLELAGLPLTGWIRRALANHHFFVPFSLAGGGTTALLLFILARVFDQRTRLTEDVEGTV